MALWFFHESYKALDVETVDGYLKKFPINQLDVIPKFNGNPCSVVAHIVEFTRCIYYENAQHEDIFLWLFLVSLGSEKKYWIKHS
jgi:hypothetical protein